MSATSGISGSDQLTQVFTSSFETRDVRFLKVTIWNDSLVPASSIPPEGNFEDDLQKLPELLEDDEPAYILARLDGPGVEWLTISYVPDTAKVRDKMLYASTRAALSKALGSAHFVDAIFATSKADLTPTAYAAHRASASAPQPLSQAERETADIREAERQASSGSGATGSYSGIRARKNHVGPIGFAWAPEAEEAVKGLSKGQGNRLVVLAVDPVTENLTLKSSISTSAARIGSDIPSTDPSFAFFAWEHIHANSPRRDIVFIYSCPSSSPIKSRMVYSLGVNVIVHQSKLLVPTLVARKIETTNPAEIDEAYLISHLDLANLSVVADGPSEAVGGNANAGRTPNRFGEEGKSFARPKGPGRKR